MTTLPPPLSAIHLKLLRQIEARELPATVCTRDQHELRLLLGLHLAGTALGVWWITDAGRAQLAREYGVFDD